MTTHQLLAVGTGGFIGSVARYLISKNVDQKFPSLFPFGTFTVNFFGCLIIGLIYGLSIRGQLNDNWRLFLGTGICGGFTTFSAFALENYMLLNQKPAVALGYMLASVVAGIAGVALGVFLARSL